LFIFAFNVFTASTVFTDTPITLGGGAAIPQAAVGEPITLGGGAALTLATGGPMALGGGPVTLGRELVTLG